MFSSTFPYSCQPKPSRKIRKIKKNVSNRWNSHRKVISDIIYRITFTSTFSVFKGNISDRIIIIARPETRFSSTGSHFLSREPLRLEYFSNKCTGKCQIESEAGPAQQLASSSFLSVWPRRTAGLRCLFVLLALANNNYTNFEKAKQQHNK